MQDELSPQGHSSGFLATIVIVGLMSIGFAWFIYVASIPPVSPRIGREFPPIEVAGWINASDMNPDDLKGKVLVIDAWAYWCGPCRMATPMLLHLHQKYRDRPVSFVGLTSEGLDPRSLEQSKKYVQAESIPWPNGYGAVNTLSALEVNSIPQFWVVDRQNRIVAHVEGLTPSLVEVLEQGIIKALEESPAP